MKSVFRALTVALAAASLTGCAGYIRTVAKVQNFGIDLNPKSVNAHLYAEVSRDEEWVGGIFLNKRAQYFPSGVLDDNGTQNFRVAEVWMTLLDEGSYFPPIAYGSQFIFRVGAVPDQFPRLTQGDIVELRNVGTWDTMIDFPKTGEGNAITRVVCKVESPDFKACRASLPRLGVSPRPAGPTPNPFKPSLKDYAPLTFTKWYDDKGNALRSFPEQAPVAFSTQVEGLPEETIETPNGPKRLAPVEDRQVTYRMPSVHPGKSLKERMGFTPY